MELSEREQIVLDVLSHNPEEAMSTGDVLTEAKAYDDTLQHNRQITRTFDSLEERGLIVTEDGDADPPLAAPRLARLTLAGEQAAMSVEVAPVSVDDLSDLEEELNSLASHVDRLQTDAANDDDLAALEADVERLKRRIDQLAGEVGQSDDLAELEDRVESLEGSQRWHVQQIDALEERVDDVDEDVEYATSIAEEAWAFANGIARKLDLPKPANLPSRKRKVILSNNWPRKLRDWKR
ncbi:hypothetical protein GS429_15860 [Natronorubrum sp. JWXQ-INN-674]|uniref:Uncharacterized protein n=1 Tax=Natronorubrum halalkaliphilum TaxID=2691917 RepID=A0A6B0VPV8_9EURY|nr:hypothetical protein [Natronorubrum halalkaliphilum]MXV63504.1 hypothetical protein [Natronorubrum halalkaliphilum]